VWERKGSTTTIDFNKGEARAIEFDLNQLLEQPQYDEGKNHLIFHLVLALDLALTLKTIVSNKLLFRTKYKVQSILIR
jgi:hypothetical protein